MSQSPKSPIVSVRLDLSAAQVDLLWHTASSNFTREQPDRFAGRGGPTVDLAAFGDEATLFWFDTTIEALIFAAAEEAAGYRAVHLCDECGLEVGGSEVVLSSRTYAWVVGA